MHATSGGASAASSAIWPGPRMPISTTATSQPSDRPSSDIGTPTSVLRLPGVPSAFAPAARSIATRMSLVVVLPVAPVTPITRAPLRSSAIRAGGLEHRERVGAHQHRAAHPLRVALDPAPRRLAHQGGGRAVAQRVGRVLAAVGQLAAQPDEQRALHRLARSST